MTPAAGTATAPGHRSATRPAVRPAAQPAPRSRLRVVPAPRPAPRRAPFVTVVIGVLVLGLAALLLLNTVLAQGSFRVHDLEREVGLLADEEQALQQKVAELAAPARLAQQARSLGMVPMTTPAFLRASDGKVLGRPSAAVGAVPQWAAPVVRPHPAPAPAPAPTVKPSQTSGGKAGDKPGTTADARSGDKSRDKPGTTADSSGDGGGR